MKEIDKYSIYKEKLQGICDENDLTFSLRNDRYPFLLTIKPVSGVDAQMSMMEESGGTGETGYISPDASIVFAYKDGDLTYKISDTFTISDKLFAKIKNLFKNLHFCWMQHFFRDRMEHEPRSGGESDPTADTDGFVVESDSVADDMEKVADVTAGDAENVAGVAADDQDDPFADFMGQAAPSTDQDTE